MFILIENHHSYVLNKIHILYIIIGKAELYIKKIRIVNKCLLNNVYYIFLFIYMPIDA